MLLPKRLANAWLQLGEASSIAQAPIEHSSYSTVASDCSLRGVAVSTC